MARQRQFIVILEMSVLHIRSFLWSLRTQVSRERDRPERAQKRLDRSFLSTLENHRLACDNCPREDCA